MLSFLKLIRYQNLLMILLTMCLIHYVLVPFFIDDHQLPLLYFVYLVLGVICISASGYVINDLYDIRADQINKPGKNYIEGTISIKHAKYSYGLLSFLGIGFGVIVSTKIGHASLSLFFVVTAILLFLYTRYFKRLLFLGNLLIGVLVSLPIFMVYIYAMLQTPYNHSLWEIPATRLYNIVLYYMFFSFVTTLIREIIKDIEDVNGDYHMKMKTAPIVLGIKRTRNVAIFFSIVLVLCLIIINQMFVGNIEFFMLGIYNYGLLVVPLLYFVYALWNAKTRKQFSFLSSFLKWIMFAGVLSMVLFKF